MLTISLVVFIIFLELGSRQFMASESALSAPPILVCHLDYYPVDEEKITLISKLVDKHQNGEMISDLELYRAALSAPQEDMPGLNGIVCNEMIIVSDRLQGAARSYVIRHELEHVFQLVGLKPDCQDMELCATWVAAFEYPLGFVLTVISSLIEGYREFPSFREFLFSSWYIFKIYLLPNF
jgi:hypothetical protein